MRNHVYRTIGVLLLTVVWVFAANAQDVTKDQGAQQQPAATDKQTTTPDYVFPTPKERFKRYVSDTVGPWPLARAAASAGIQQWKDSPEEWGQGAEGYGKRFASNLGRNAIRQTVTYGLDSALDLDTGFKKASAKVSVHDSKRH